MVMHSMGWTLFQWNNPIFIVTLGQLDVIYQPTDCVQRSFLSVMFTQEISRSGAKISDLKYLISLVYL